MFDRKIITPAVVLFILLLLGCISYAQFLRDDVTDQPSEDVVSDTTDDVSNESSSPPQVLDYTFWHGLWDSWEYEGDEFNTVKVIDPSQATNVDGFVVVSLSHRWKNSDGRLKTRPQWRSIIRGQASNIAHLDPEKTIVLIQDEPAGRYTLSEQKFLYEECKNQYGEIPCGFSGTRYTALKRDIPPADFFILFMYPFEYSSHLDTQIHTQQAFNNFADKHIDALRDKTDADIFLAGQGFYNPDTVSPDRLRWRKPPLEAPKWYADYVATRGLKGLIWWLYRSSDQFTGLEDMPDYFERIKEL